MRKETLVFMASLAIIFVIGYVNMTMSPNNLFGNDNANEPNEAIEGEISEIIEGGLNDAVAAADLLDNESDYEIIGDITDLSNKPDAANASSEGVLGVLNANFTSFKLNKEKGNADVLDYLEESLSSAVISDDTKAQFEQLLLKKNSFIEAEQGIEIMLQSKGYKETVAIVDESMVKVISNDTIEQQDATRILDVVVSETKYEPSQIKIVKFDNIDL